MIKFSIIIPNYNEGKYIRECLESVFSQTYKNYEVIVVDDGSTDDSIDIIKDFDVKLYHSNGLHAGGARNVGLDNANGEYIVFLDSDDYLANNNVLENLNNLIRDEDIICLNYIMFRNNVFEDINDVEGDISVKIEKTTFLGAPTKCFKRSLIGDTRFPTSQRYEDIVFTLENMCKANSYNELKDAFFIYRKVENSNSTSALDVDAILAVNNEIIKLYKLCVKYPKYKENLLKRIKHDKIDKRFGIIEYMLENNIDSLEVSEFFNLLNK